MLWFWVLTFLRYLRSSMNLSEAGGIFGVSSSQVVDFMGP
jgi:hypothetical protein